MFRLIVLFAALATINAQYALTSQNQNIYRSPYNLGQVATHSKTIDTPYSSVSKSDVRVSNPGIYSGYAAPTYHGYAAPAYAAPAYGVPALAHAGYAGIAPAYTPSAYAPAAYAPSAYHRPAVAAVPGVGLLGVAYSAAPTVAHMSYSNGLGVAYTW